MDPISIATTTGHLVGLCIIIYQFINNTKTVDKTVQALAKEIDSLSQVLQALSERFNDPSINSARLELETGHEGQYWRHIKRSMDDCTETLKNLEKVLMGVTKKEDDFLRRPRMQIKWEMKLGDIAALKQQIAAYGKAMQLSLQLITM
jgi:uncharacterized protein YoxC